MRKASRYDRRVTEIKRLDAIDQQILDRLRRNAREPAATIARHVGLTASAVRRRIARLEESGVINRYTIALNHDRLGSSIEAYVELTFNAEADVQEFLEKATRQPEVREAMTLAGEADALVRVRVGELKDLRDLVIGLRRSGDVTDSKIRIVLGRFWHGSVQQAEGGQPT